MGKKKEKAIYVELKTSEVNQKTEANGGRITGNITKLGP
jgi:hypothetical protein